jgi:predicted acylesterase/phospholipase RssA
MIIKTLKIFSTAILSHKIEDFINLKVLNILNIGYHLNLAFQGGGAKGVSYVGVYKAIKNLQRRIEEDERNKSKKLKLKLPIKSVIGSSAGGILSLAISA